MDLIDKRIQDYSEKYTSDESPVLHSLDILTHKKVDIPQMLSGKLQGRFLSMISRMIKPDCILEIGTYTGYSAICLAEGLAINGRIHTIDNNNNIKPIANEYFGKASVKNMIEFHIGSALDIIPTINDRFDLVFIDADKSNYSNYFDLVIDQVNTGGFIVADNVLWSGRVLDEDEDQDNRTKSLDAYNKKIMNDDRVENILVPIRDGLMIAQKIV